MLPWIFISLFAALAVSFWFLPADAQTKHKFTAFVTN